MAINADKLRHTMRHWATGVTVVSVEFEGVIHGMTASSFTSLSLDPPYVMVSLECRTRTHELVSQKGAFGVTILAEDQQEISNRFANLQTDTGHRFDGLDIFQLETGSPFIKGGLAYLDCRVVEQLHAGTHTVFVGEVCAAQDGVAHHPLLYFYQGYRQLKED